MKHQCPSTAQDSPPVKQEEMFDAGLLRDAASNEKNAIQSDTKAGEVVSGSDSKPTPKSPILIHRDDDRSIRLFHGNCLELLDSVIAKYPDGLFDMVFADPPYFLSNGGFSCQSGSRVSVDKGSWDKSQGFRQDFKFTQAWLRRCQRALNHKGTLWISGTHHSIHLVGYVLQKLGFKILNTIAWEKTNPPPNLSCRFFTHSMETLIWASRDEDSEHVFNYDLMRRVNRGSQMQSVWRMNAPGVDEKTMGEHPTQKPVPLITRCLLASTCEGDLVLDPFMGSGTTAIACLRTRRRFVGIDVNETYVKLAEERVKAETSKGEDFFVSPSDLKSSDLNLEL